ncbi:hypothetical protein K474DRAFT_1710319 [Panus rudis PR-1116 ss-1]|nr:hypothetical protein K474DRAFT_1710319 [Panus rudis PR-1116 ss-1]
MASTTFAKTSATLTALVQILQSPQADYDIKEEIDKLGHFVAELSMKLVVIDLNLDYVIHSRDISEDLQRKLQKVFDQWEDGVLTTFVLTAQKSGKIADSAVLTCKVEDFLERQDSHVEEAKDVSQGFSDVRTGVENMVHDVKVILDDYDVPAAEARISELDTEIKGLLEDLDKIRKQVADLSEQLDIVIAATSVTGIFGFLCPVWWVATAISATQIPSLKAQLSVLQTQQNGEYHNHLNPSKCLETYSSRMLRPSNTLADKISRIQAKSDERDRLQNEIDFIAGLRSQMEQSEPDTETIKTKLAALATVWAAIRADSQAMLIKLEQATNTESLELFKLRVKTAAEMYQKLQTAMQRYGDIVREPDGGVKKAIIALEQRKSSR